MSSPYDLGGPMPAVTPSSGSATREVRYGHSAGFPELLARLGASLLVSTYQAGKLVSVGTRGGSLVLGFSNFERPMGLALRPDGIAVADRALIWLLRGDRSLAPRLDPPGAHDLCLLARSAHYTGEVQAHEIACSGGELWFVNTAYSCLCTIDPDSHFVPRWRPPFVSALAGEDRCHLNGLAVENGRPKYVTALGETDAPEGWRPNKAAGGVLIDVATGETVARGFAMPHSPRVHGGRVYLLDSGRGRLVTADPQTGRVEPVAEVPGYARGLGLHGPVAFVGLSKIRETSTFGGLPVAERRGELRCGVAAVDLASGRVVETLEFRSGVEEIFDVLVLPGVRDPAVRGPHAAADGAGDPLVVAPLTGGVPPSRLK
jgi:uncharacterized protein (TIGR03032 family)